MVIIIKNKWKKDRMYIKKEEADKVMSYIDLFASHVLVIVHHRSSAVQGRSSHEAKKGIQIRFRLATASLMSSFAVALSFLKVRKKEANHTDPQV